MGNIFTYLSTEPVDVIKAPDDDKNRYYWFGVIDDDIEVYRLMESDDD